MKQVVIRAYGARIINRAVSEPLAITILARQNRLWNALVEIENDTRAAYLEALSASHQETATVTAAIEAEQANLDKLIVDRNKDRVKARSKTGDVLTMWAARIKQSSGRIKELRAELKRHRADAKEAAKPKLEALEESRRARVKQAAADSDLWWCHSETIIAKYDIARVRAMKQAAGLRFHRFAGEGSFGVRFSSGHGTTLDKIQDGSTSLLQIRRPTEEELGRRLEVKADGNRRFVLRMRAGKPDEETGEVAFIEWMVTAHGGHHLPLDVPLKTVTMRCDEHAGRKEWKVIFMFSREIDALPEVDLPAAAVGIDLGWRLLDSGSAERRIRVAAIEDGEKTTHVELSTEWIRRMEHADALRGELDKKTNAFVSQAVVHLEELELGDESRFDILAGKLKRAEQRRVKENSDRAYTNLAIAVCEAHEAAGDPVGPGFANLCRSYLFSARRANTVQHHIRRKAVDNRKHIFRNAASQIVKRAGLIAMEDMDLRELALKEKPDGEVNKLPDLARKYRVWAAPSELRLAIRQAAQREQREIVEVAAKNTTLTCSHCGHLNQGPLTDYRFSCAGCGWVLDQDENAAKNIRKLALEGRILQAA